LNIRSQLENIVLATNTALTKRKDKSTYKGEILKCLGIRMAVALEQRRRSVKDWFSKDITDEDRIFSGGNYEIRFQNACASF
jgi:hypothetical protein